MKQLLVHVLVLCCIAGAGPAVAVTCSVTATSIPLSTLYATGAATQLTGTISGTCTKQSGDANQPYVYIGINQGEPPSGRAMTRQNGTEQLTYEIYHRTYGSGLWTEGAGGSSTSTLSGGVLYRMTSSAAPQPFSFPYYFRIPTPQAGKPAGIYDDLAIGVSVRLSNLLGSATGALLASTSFGVSASIQHSCYFSSVPSALVINYTSFAATASTGSAAFQLSCTYNTPYNLSVSSPATSLLDVNYALALNATSGNGTGAPQSFIVNGTAEGNQSGTCATAVCSASKVHTITVSF